MILRKGCSRLAFRLAWFLNGFLATRLNPRRSGFLGPFRGKVVDSCGNENPVMGYAGSTLATLVAGVV